MTAFADMLAPYLAGAEESDPTSLAIAVGDRVACRLIAAFSKLPLPEWKRPRVKLPDDARERWMWLWAGFEGGPDDPLFLDELALRAGVTRREARRAWPAIVGSRMVFPNGTVSEDALNAVRMYVAPYVPRAPLEQENRELRAEVERLKRELERGQVWPRGAR